MSRGNEMQFRDRAVYFPDAETLVVTDLHLGRSKLSGIEVPLDRAVRVRPRLARLVETLEPRRVVLAGDILDSFRELPDGVEAHLDALISTVEDAGSTVVVLRGNHDTLLPTSYDGDIHDEFAIGGTVIAHGHEELGESADRYVIGHEHPAIRMVGVKRPCFLHGRTVWKGADVIVLPAFSRLLRGSTVNRREPEDCHAPVLQETGLDAFRPIVRDESAGETLTFPPLGALRSHL